MDSYFRYILYRILPILLFFMPSLFTDAMTRIRVTAPDCTKLLKTDLFSMNRKVVQASYCLAFAFRHPCFY